MRPLILSLAIVIMSSSMLVDYGCETTSYINNEETTSYIEEEEPTQEIEYNQLDIIMKAAETWLDSRDVEIMTKCVYGEAGICPDIEKSGVVWVILNRYDAGHGTIEQIITKPKQFTGYKADRTDYNEKLYNHCKDIVIDVYTRWYAEKLGVDDVGRALPQNYYSFWGDGKHNHFRTNTKSHDYWDWSLGNPYEEE